MTLAGLLSRLRSRRDSGRSEMTPERWDEVTRIVDEATRRPQREERARYLRAACRNVPALRREVEKLLRFADTDTRILAAPLLSPDATASPIPPVAAVPPLAPGQRLGPYRIERILGDGGMGVVALASDPELGRRVAVKLIRRELVGARLGLEEILQRFDAERRILARLDHPYVARILGTGHHEGLPYFAMEYVDGEPIDIYCDRRRLAVEERLALVLKVCAALEHAHRNLVVHRDLKPGNVLVTASGDPRLVDFGIAKELAAAPEAVASQPPRTRTGRQPLTPAYASPEQVRGRAITTASDVYALGVVLYELLCGHPPYVLDGDWLENARRICEDEPPPPSSRTVVAREVWKDGFPTMITPAEIARARSSDPPRRRFLGSRGGNPLRRRLRGDLDSIVLKALAKDPERRYHSMEQLSEDLRRHLEGRPVGARRATFRYRTGKFLLRNRWRVAAAGLLAALLLTGVTTTVRNAREIERIAASERRAAAEAQAAERQAESLTRFMRNLLRASDPDTTGGQPLTAREILDRAEAQVRRDLEGDPESLAHQLEAIGLAHQERGRYAAARPLLAESLRLRRRVYGGDHPLTARGLNNLGALEHVAGDLDRAAQLYRLALAMRRRLGQADEELVKVESNLASILLHRGRYDEAERLYRRVLAVRIRAWGPGDEDVATTLRSLGILYYLRSDFSAAEPLLRKALTIRRRVHGPRSTRVAAVWSSLGRVLQARGLYEEAEAALTEALSIREKLLGDGHPHVALSHNDLAVLYFDLGEDATAEVLWNRAAVLRATKDPGSWEIADAESRLGARLAGQGRYAEAEVCLATSYDTLRRLRGEEAIYSRAARRRLEELPTGQPAGDPCPPAPPPGGADP